MEINLFSLKYIQEFPTESSMFFSADTLINKFNSNVYLLAMLHVLTSFS
jgi:hypothetical protein